MHLIVVYTPHDPTHLDDAVISDTNTNTYMYVDVFNTLVYNNIPDGRPLILYHTVKTDNLSLVKIVTSDKESDGNVGMGNTKARNNSSHIIDDNITDNNIYSYKSITTSKKDSDGNVGMGDTKISDNASHTTDDNVSG